MGGERWNSWAELEVSEADEISFLKLYKRIPERWSTHLNDIEETGRSC